jgi:hypothetical protein
MQSLLLNKEEEIRKLSNKEKELTKVNDSLSVTAKKYDFILVEKEDLVLLIVN